MGAVVVANEKIKSCKMPLLMECCRTQRTRAGDGARLFRGEGADPTPIGLRTASRSSSERQEGISRFYIIQVVFRNALEIGFLLGQLFLYGFSVPGLYEMWPLPCIKEVECYVSRPTEDCFLVFMFAVAASVLWLNLAELNLGWRKIKLAVRGPGQGSQSMRSARTCPGQCSQFWQDSVQ